MSIATVATPHPSSPTRGEVPLNVSGMTVPRTPPFTLPLVGRVGEGAAARTEPARVTR
jgi:hypothetical protein